MPTNAPNAPTVYVTTTAMHEAGHAVVAAYLHIPFYSVSMRVVGETGGRVRIKRKPVTGLSCNDCLELIGTDNAITEKVLRDFQEYRTKLSMMCLASRVAVEEELSFREDERAYRSDEQQVKTHASLIGISDSEFESWRAELLEKTKQIVRIPYVEHAIIALALELDKAGDKSIPSKRVREILRKLKDWHRNTSLSVSSSGSAPASITGSVSDPPRIVATGIGHNWQRISGLGSISSRSR